MSYTIVTGADIGGGDGAGRPPTGLCGADPHYPNPPSSTGFHSLFWNPVFCPIVASPPPEEPRPPSPMRTSLIMAALILAATWLAFGKSGGQPVYDGWFHVVNGSGEDHDVAITPPSGE